VHFKGEPAIDEGGVRKEYFQCVMKEILNPQYHLFTFNEENRLYWFNGQTFEPNINFELVGTLMGIALYNNTFIDLPFPHACFKILLDQDVNLEDYAQWQPDTAKSLQYILDYKDHDRAPIESVILRNFTIDVECFGAVNEVELKEGGKDIPVTRENRREFVDLFVKFSLIKQCEGQLASFKKGFNRMVDLPVLKALFDAEDLEQLICGTRTLDFNELKSVALYANGFTPDSPMMKWFWDIVLNEWDDEMRRKLLIFTTASDRAPVNGLKTLKFVLVLEGEGDGRLPSSHTCYNQLHIPQYSS
jgi:ubiquitin-protein ligase E3 A